MSSGWDDGPLLGPVVSLVSPLASASGSRYPECVSGRVSLCVWVYVYKHVRERGIDRERDSRDGSGGARERRGQAANLQQMREGLFSWGHDLAGRGEHRIIWGTAVQHSQGSCWGFSPSNLNCLSGLSTEHMGSDAGRMVPAAGSLSQSSSVTIAGVVCSSELVSPSAKWASRPYLPSLLLHSCM